MDINEDAPVITRDEILIEAPIETAWEIQTNIDEWPSWQPGTTNMTCGSNWMEGRQASCCCSPKIWIPPQVFFCR